MIRFILYVIIFFLLYRVVKLVTRFFIEQKNKNSTFNKSSKTKTNYNNVVEAEFIELEDEPVKEKNNNS